MACAKASPTSRNVTSRNGGGRSSTGFEDECKRAPPLASCVRMCRSVDRRGYTSPFLGEVGEQSEPGGALAQRAGHRGTPTRPPVATLRRSTSPAKRGRYYQVLSHRFATGLARMIGSHYNLAYGRAPPKHTDLLVRRHHAARCRGGEARLPRGERLASAPALPRRARQAFAPPPPAMPRSRSAACRRRRCSRRRSKAPAATFPSSTSARPPAGRRTARQPARRWQRCIAAAAEPAPDVPFVRFESEGVALIYGCDDAAIEAGNLLKDHLDVTVLIKPGADVTPPRVTDFPIVQGNIRSATGHLGAFEIIVDEFAEAAPSSRGALAFDRARDGAVSRCDIMLDLSGGSAAVHRARSARRLSARRSPRSRRRAAGRAQGARPRRQLRQAALHRLYRRPLRAFALAASSAAAAASISVRPARSRRRAITSSSTRISARAAASAPPCARPAPPPMRCRRRGCADAQAARPAHRLPRGRRHGSDRARCTTTRTATR